MFFTQREKINTSDIYIVDVWCCNFDDSKKANISLHSKDTVCIKVGDKYCPLNDIKNDYRWRRLKYGKTPENCLLLDSSLSKNTRNSMYYYVKDVRPADLKKFDKEIYIKDLCFLSLTGEINAESLEFTY